MRIRGVEHADLLGVHRIERRSFPSPWPYRAFERHLDAPAFLVATRDPAADPEATIEERVVGFVVGDQMPNHGQPLGHVKDLAVDPDSRGEGIGRSLLERALGTLAGEGVRRTKLEVRASNETAIGLYRSVGFEPARRLPRYYDDGEDGILMVRFR